MPSGSSNFHVLVVNAFNRDQARKHFLNKGRSYTEGYLYAKRGRGRLRRWFLLDSEYEGAKEALSQLP